MENTPKLDSSIQEHTSEGNQNIAHVLSDIDHEVLVKNRELNDGLVGSGAKENLTNIRKELYEEYDNVIPSFSEKMIEADTTYEDKLKELKNAYNSLEIESKSFEIKTDILRMKLLNEKDSLRDEEYNTLQQELQQRLDKQKEFDEKLVSLWQQRLNVPQDKKEEKESFITNINKDTERKTVEDEPNIIESSKAEEAPLGDKEEINTKEFEIAAIGKELSDLSQEQQVRYESSVKKYASLFEEYGEKMFLEKQEMIRESYKNVMRDLGLESSEWGNTDRWIVWDLAKQAYFAEHPEESNENYKLANPFEEGNSEVLTDIIDRHVGWEVLGYIKTHPEFINTLNTSDENFSKIHSVLNEGLINNRLPSYKLVELGKLLRVNKKT